MTDELPSGNGELVLRVVPRPSDVNAAGDIFGGWIMAQVDIAGSIPALRRSRGRVATVAVNSFTFKKPVYVADLVTFYAQIIKVGTTSITVEVKVYAERGWRAPNPGEIVLVTDAVLTYVAIDQNGNKRTLQPE